MPIFLADYDRFLADLREAALSGDWRSAMAEVLAGADLLPEVCRGDFEGEGREAA